MTDQLTALTAQRQENGIFRIAHDGRILGDSRGYSDKAACEAAIAQQLAVDARDAVRYDRPIMYRKG